MPRTSCDLLIEAGWLVTMVPTTSPSDNAIAIRDGRILEVGAASSLGERYDASETVRLPQHILLPGLVNAHGHLAMSLFRGHAEDAPLQSWLKDRIWPLEAQWVSPEFSRDGVQLALLEMLRAGITTFSDMYYFPEVTAEQANQAGMRAQVAFPVIDFPNVWSDSADAGIHKGLALNDEYRHEPLVDIAFGPHSVGTVNTAALDKVLMFSEELDINIQIHLHENAAELADNQSRLGTSGISYLHERGLLSPRLQAVHVTQIQPEEIELFAAANAHVVHCPISNAKLASGVCPSTTLLDAGVNVCLGTDGAASNNRLSVLAEARFASLLAKLDRNDAAALPAGTALAMATINGAKALGLDRHIGSLEAGKQADVIALDTRAPELQPLYDPAAGLLHAAGDPQVTHVWVGGLCLLRERQCLRLDEAGIMAAAQSWQDRLAQG